MTILYGLKNCDTCKKALKALSAAGIEHSFVDIRAETDLAAKVPGWLVVVGGKTLLNSCAIADYQPHPDQTSRHRTWRRRAGWLDAGDPVCAGALARAG
jgi:hypothetical protein